MGAYAIFDNKQNKIISDFFSNRKEVEELANEIMQGTPDASLKIVSFGSSNGSEAS